MNKPKFLVALVMVLCVLVPTGAFAASHREAPITALDRTADITDWYTFVSYDHPDRITMILNVDPLLEPSNGPNYFPFDPNVLYEMKVDNDRDGKEDIVFQFRFNTEIRQPGLFTGFVGDLAGIPPIRSLDGPDSAGLSLRQTYTVTMLKNGHAHRLGQGKTLFAVPSNVGPKTMPEYQALFNQGLYDLADGVRVFAGTVDDPFFIDLGAAFDSLNFRMGIGGAVPPAIDADDSHNYAPDAVGGYNVNTIVLEVPITWLTEDGKLHPAGDKRAVIGTYGATSRPELTIRRSPRKERNFGKWRQVQRMGNPLVNELIIGTGSKDRFSMDDPENDKQFANFFLNPLLADVFGTLGIPVPPKTPQGRVDLLLLAQYQPPICPGCGANDKGAIADLLRLNTGIPPTPAGSQKRLGVLAGDFGGFPNGRRPVDDVLDIAGRAVAGILVDSKAFGTPIGDGVNINPEGLNNSFPYEMPANDGRNSHHIGPGQDGCTGQPSGICPVQ